MSSGHAIASSPASDPAPRAGFSGAVKRRLSGASREVRFATLGVLAFLGVTIWWLTQDDRVQDWDNGLHTIEAFTIRDEIASGHLTAPFTEFNTYPPFGHFVGALGVLVGGKSPASAILASNLVFVPLLAAGCFGVGRLVYRSERAGLLAALFALGTPMIVSEMHEMLLDPQQAAMVAVSVWAILASDRFRRPWIALLAGVLCGLAMLTKETTEIFLAGLLAVAFLRGGWRNLRGVLAFAVALFAVAGPWYLYHRHQLNGLVALHEGQLEAGANAAGSFFPERFSRKSFGWYFWSTLNIQLLAPLALATLVGTGLAIRECVRRWRPENLLPELLGGALVSWIGVTLITHKDPRYSLPALIYMAVLGTGWIATATRRRTPLTAALVAVVLINLIGISTGFGNTLRIALPGAPTSSVLAERHITLYSPDGWLRGGAEHDGDLLALMRGLKRVGVRNVTFDAGSADSADFNTSGLQVLAIQAGLPPTTVYNPAALGPHDAFMLRHVPQPWDPPPCQRLRDGTGVYVVLGYAYIPFSNYTFICPTHHPLLYKRTAPLPPGAPAMS
ncbi:MAG: glycosyltransferase family 39 protein [Solirubrobacteraceae bacterium]